MRWRDSTMMCCPTVSWSCAESLCPAGDGANRQLTPCNPDEVSEKVEAQCHQFQLYTQRPGKGCLGQKDLPKCSSSVFHDRFCCTRSGEIAMSLLPRCPVGHRFSTVPLDAQSILAGHWHQHEGIIPGLQGEFALTNTDQNIDMWINDDKWW